MHEQNIRFHSDGLALQGSWYVPDDFDPDRRHPAVVPCSGFTGLKDAHPARFARYLTARGHLCFGFDYRGFARSDGPRGRVVLDEQVRDIAHAVAYVESDPRVDRDRVVLLGWGMGGGLVLEAARALPAVAGVIVANGFYRGERVQAAHRSTNELAAFRERVRRERIERARTGHASSDDAFAYYPLDDASRRYVDSTLRALDDYETEGYTSELGDALLRFAPEAHAPTMHLPLLIAHGTDNLLHPRAEAESLYRAYAGPKQLLWLEGAGHTEFMHDDDPTFRALADSIDGWITRLFEPAVRVEGRA